MDFLSQVRQQLRNFSAVFDIAYEEAVSDTHVNQISKKKTMSSTKRYDNKGYSFTSSDFRLQNRHTAGSSAVVILSLLEEALS